MQIKLDGKRAFITGSSAGIGFAIARSLAAAGASVILNGRSATRIEAAKQKILSTVPAARLEGVVGDIGSAADIQAMVTQIGAVDILVNNAAIFTPKTFADIPDEEWELFFRVNVLSGVRLSRALLPGMLAKGWGRIVFISSEAGLNMPAEMLHYGVTKTAQLALSRGLAELAVGKDVTVNAVCPGPTKSEGIVGYLEGLAKQTGQSIEAVQQDFITNHRSTSIIRRFSEVDEVASLVTYVVSPQASSTTGATLRVDGGIIRSFN